jgi:hypothetical protein
MRRAALIAGLLAAAPAHAAERSYSVTDFDRIRVIGPYIVEVETGKGPSARASGPLRALDALKVEVTGRMLTIRAGSGGWGGWPGEKVAAPRIRVTVPMVRGIALDGPGTLSITTVRSPRVSIAAQGSGSVKVARVETDRLDLGLAGDTRMELVGTARDATISATGASTLVAPALRISDLTLTWQSSGDAALTVARAAKVTATGPGDVIVAGSPACTVNAMGAGRVACGKGPSE